MTTLCGKVTPCLSLSVSDLRGVASVRAHTHTHTKGHIQTQQSVPIFASTFRRARFPEGRRTNSAATQWPHKSGRHEGSLSEIWGSAGRKRNTPLDPKRKWQDKRAGQALVFWESGLHEPERHDWARLVAAAQPSSLLAFQINQSFRLDER